MLEIIAVMDDVKSYNTIKDLLLQYKYDAYYSKKFRC